MACPTCGATQVFRKSDVAFEVGFGGGTMVVSTFGNRHLRCTLDICGNCGRTDTYIQNVQDWLARNGYDAVFDTGGAETGGTDSG
jgi:hypothetical protein